MKEIKAFIKPSKVTIVIDALERAGFDTVTLSKGEGTGTYVRPQTSLGREFFFTNSSVIKLELVCQNEEAEEAIRLISQGARSRERADGIIYLTEIEDAFHIKTMQSLRKQ